MESLLGCIIVTQPSDIAALGMTRTIDFLRHKEIPIMGLVTMMDGYLCPSCGLVTHQLLSPKLDMEKVAKDCGVPFLISTFHRLRMWGYSNLTLTDWRRWS